MSFIKLEYTFDLTKIQTAFKMTDITDLTNDPVIKADRFVTCI